jgi:hypothetical protein
MERRGRRASSLVVAAALLLVGVPRLFDPATVSLAEAIRQLGPVSGWRCARSATYAYDPRRDSPDPTLLADPPEQLLWDQVPHLQVERVEADLRGGDTVVWTRIVGEDDSHAERRVYVLSPGRLQTIAFDPASGGAAICNGHLGAWHIVGEHGLE